MLPAALCATFAALTSGPPPTPANLAAAVERSLPLLAKAATGHAEQKTCFACHNQAVPMLAFATAKASGFDVDEELIDAQADHVHDFLTQNKDAYRSGAGTGGQADTAGWALYMLHKAGRKADDTTAAVAEYLLKKDADRDHWRTSSNRPPSEASSFATTYFAVRTLTMYGTREQAERVDKRVATAGGWFRKTPAKDTEDRVFRLRGLKVTGADSKSIRGAAQALLEAQRWDGGWGQLPTLPSDAYATATVLTALRDTDTPPDDPVYRRGLTYLLRTQLADGTWFVKSRSKPFQPYYESGFPHGKDQFIAVAATAWATAILADASDGPAKAAPAP